jgi:hypothetical protein
LTELQIYTLLLVLCVLYINTGFSFLISPKTGVNDQNLLLIEQLTIHSSKPKNYRYPANEYASFGYGINGIITADKASFSYEFPFIDHRNVTFKSEITTSQMSDVVSHFGAHSSCYAKVDASHFALQTSDEDFLNRNMNKDGFFFRSFERYEYGVDYNQIIADSKELSSQIGAFIIEQLGSNDSYDNRVLAALNFVQYIPYGQPHFDAGEYTYFGVSVPHESFVISYSDCDSKSVMLCGILQELIVDAHLNLIMVYCTVGEEHHMIVGVHGLRIEGKTHEHNGRSYLLLETTTPLSVAEQQQINFENIHVFNLTYNA